MAEKQQCSEQVYPNDRWGAFNPHQCHKPAIVERDGKWYCKVHDPEYKKKKEANALTKYQSQLDESIGGEKAWRQCKEVNPDNPMAVAESIGEMYEALENFDCNIGFVNDTNPYKDELLKVLASNLRQALTKAKEKQ